MKQTAKLIPRSCMHAEVSEKVNFMNKFSSNIDRIIDSKLPHHFILFHHHLIIKKILILLCECRIGDNTVKIKVSKTLTE